MTLSASSLSLEINSSSDSNPALAGTVLPVVNFKLHPLVVETAAATGATPARTKTIDFESALLRASGRVELGITGVYVAADIWFEQTTRPNGTKIIKIAAGDLRIELGDAITVTGSMTIAGTGTGGTITKASFDWKYAGFSAGQLVRIAGIAGSWKVATFGADLSVLNLTGCSLAALNGTTVTRSVIGAPPLALTVGDLCTPGIDPGDPPALLLITPQGLAGQFTVAGIDFTIGETTGAAPWGVHANLSFQIAFNTSGIAVNETFRLPAGNTTLVVPAGPYFRLTAGTAASPTCR